MRITSIEAALASMPEPEHSDQRGLDNRKWSGNRAMVDRLKPDQFSPLFKGICDEKGYNWEEVCSFFSGARK